MASLTLTVTKTSAAVNLTSLGAANWVAWFSGSTTPSQSKSGGSGSITASIIGGGSPSYYSGDPRTISWTDGTPTTSGSSDEGTFNSNFNVGAGFDVVFPADTTTKTAYLYVGYFDANAKITATLSDASAGPSSDTTTLGGTINTSFNGVVQVDYSAASAGQTLTIRVEVLSDAGGGSPNTTIQAAALIASSGPSITAQPQGAGAAVGATAQFAVTSPDATC